MSSFRGSGEGGVGSTKASAGGETGEGRTGVG